MDLNQLRTFVTVADLGHLTRAAETLHLSQPALSSHIKALEEQFGVSLFERSSSGMTLTPSGRRLLTEAEQIIAAVARLKHSAQDLRGQPTGHLKVGTVLDPAVLRVGDLMLGVFEKYPQLEVDLHQVMSSEGLARIRGGGLDASFYFGSDPGPDLTGIVLRAISYRIALPVAWADRLLGAPWETLVEEPWIVAPEPSSHRQLVVGLFGQGAQGPKRIIEVDNESVINNLVESGVGLSLIRDEIATQSVDAGLSVIWPDLEVSTELWFVHSTSRADDPLLAALVDVLGNVWGIPGPPAQHETSVSDPAAAKPSDATTP